MLWNITKTNLKTGKVSRAVFDDATDGNLDKKMLELQEDDKENSYFVDSFLHDLHLPGTDVVGPHVDEVVAQKAKDSFVAPAEKGTEADVEVTGSETEPGAVDELSETNKKGRKSKALTPAGEPEVPSDPGTP